MGTSPVEILVVEDEEVHREGMVGALEDEFESRGVRVLSAENGRQAVAVVRDGMLVFLDIEMPVMDGYGVLAYMKEHGIRPSKVVITGSKAGLNSERGVIGQKVRRAYSHPEDIAYLPKPIDVDELISTASEALGIPL